MEASLYILFPERDDVISLAVDKERLGRIIAPLVKVKEFARLHGISLKIYYDSENVRRFKEDVGSIMEDGAYMNIPTNILHSFIGSNSTDVKNSAAIDDSYCYSLWDTVTCTADPDAPIVIKNAFEAQYKPCVLSLGEKIPTDYYQISIIKDRAYAEYMPKLKIIPLFFAAEECIAWLSSCLNRHFSLLGNLDFEPTSYRWENQRIFKKKADGRYWYFDYYHRDNKIHYEVFDSNGKHLGEAGEDGRLIPETADKEKSISKILHGN